MKSATTLPPFDDDPTIVWDPTIKGVASTSAPVLDDALRALPSPLTYAPLTAAATPLLAAIIALRRAVTMPDSGTLRHTMIAAMKRFERTATERNIHADDITAANYLLCCALDEAIATTSSLGDADWSKHSLLVSFHNESWGGDKAFVLIERLREDPKRYADLLQLAYYILALGFEGRYRVINNGLLQLEELRGEIARLIERPAPPEDESKAAFGGLAAVSRPKPALYVPIWCSLAVGAVLLVALLTYLGMMIDWRAKPTDKLMRRVEQGFAAQPVVADPAAQAVTPPPVAP